MNKVILSGPAGVDNGELSLVRWAVEQVVLVTHASLKIFNTCGSCPED
jgi:hypothetical protein